MKKRLNINDVVNETIEQFGGVSVICKLQDKIEEVGLSLLELSSLTGIRYASLNELKNGKKVTLNLQHVLAIMMALRIKSFDELFMLQFDDEQEEERFDKEVDSIHVQEFGLPDTELAKIKVNKVRIAEMKKEKSTGN